MKYMFVVNIITHSSEDLLSVFLFFLIFVIQNM